MAIRHISQHDKSDCGVACLASAMYFFRKSAPGLNWLRERSGTTKLGTSMLGLLQAARECGLIAEGYEADIESLRECNDLTILHVVKEQKWSHYIVCYGYDSRKKRWNIGDPSMRDIIWLTDEELSGIWKTKKLLLLKDPNPNRDKDLSRTNKWRWLKHLVREDINILSLALFLGVCISVLGLSTAIFSQKLLDKILPSGEVTILIAGLALLFVLLLIRSGFSLIRQIFLFRQSRDFNNRILNFFFARLIRLPMTFFSRRKTGDLVARLNDIQRIQKTISTLVADVMIDVIMIIVATVGVMMYTAAIGLFVLIWIPVFGLIVWRFHRSIVNSQDLVMKNYAVNEHNFVEVVRGISTIKSHRKEKVYQNLTNKIFSDFQQSIYQLAMVGTRFNFFSEVTGTVFLILVVGWSSWLVLQEQMTSGALMAVLQLTALLMASAGTLAMTNIQLQEARIAFQRMYEFTSLNLENIENEEDSIKLSEFKELKVNQLSFRFPGRSLLLENVSFGVQKGEMISIWGEIGSGKSTLFNILLRHLIYESGEITINAKDISEIQISELRTLIGVVPQSPIVFNGSLYSNIFLGSPPSSEEALKKFLEEYGLDHIFQKFPNGYMTLLEENGNNISGGQRRMLNLVRTLYDCPQLLLLDEPTSDLDHESFHFLLTVLEQLKEQCGIINLTHDVRLARQSDRIYILKNGRMDEFGTHDELMACDNLYTNAWKDYLMPMNV